MTHADLVAAAEKARYRHTPLGDGALARNGEVEVLLAILRLHGLATDDWIYGTTGMCQTCPDDWPCPTVQIVADRLTAWGVLPQEDK